MALLRLPGHSLQFPVCRTFQKYCSPRFLRNDVALSFSPSPLIRFHLSRTLSDSILGKPRNLKGSFTSFLSTSTQEQVLESSSSPADASTVAEVVEYSKTRLIAQNVPWTSTPEDIRSLFEKYGNVVDVELSMYNKTKNRGLAFVEMASPEDATAALSNLESYEFEGRVLKVNYAKCKKKKPTPSVQPTPVPIFNLFVANLSFEARAKHLKEFFDSGSGNVVSAEIIFHDNPRRSSGYGFVSFKTKKQAEAALTDFQGKEFMGRPIRVARSKQFVKLQVKEGLQPDEESSQSNLGDEEEAAAGEN